MCPLLQWLCLDWTVIADDIEQELQLVPFHGCWSCEDPQSMCICVCVCVCVCVSPSCLSPSLHCWTINTVISVLPLLTPYQDTILHSHYRSATLLLAENRTINNQLQALLGSLSSGLARPGLAALLDAAPADAARASAAPSKATATASTPGPSASPARPPACSTPAAAPTPTHVQAKCLLCEPVELHPMPSVLWHCAIAGRTMSHC